MQILELEDYNIYVGNDTWDILNDQVKNGEYSKIVVIVDTNTNEHCLPLFHHKVDFEYETIEILDGEIHKNI